MREGRRAVKPNIIVVVSDSLRQDHVGFYAGEGSPARTPNMDAFLLDAVTFSNMYPEGLPTIPVRTEWVTGAGTLAGRSWQPLEATDVACAEMLRREGYLTAFICDVYHYFKPDMNFHRGYKVWRWIRGQEYDPYRSAPAKTRRVEDHWKDSFPPRWRERLEAYCRNLEGCRRADDFPCGRTFNEAIDWLRGNAGQRPFLLWVETFDPHEPWTPPEEFDVYGDPAYSGKDYIFPPGGQASDHFTPEEIARIRSLYAGEVSYVDAMLGRLLEALKDAGAYDESLIFFLSDHGHPLADHGKFLKGPDRMHSELLKVPFGFRLPGGELSGTRTDRLAQFPDVLPTMFEAAGLSNNLPAMQGTSLLPLCRGEVEKVRDTVISGYHGGIDRCIRDETWSLVFRPEGEPDELYNLEDDPRETQNMIDEQREVAGRLRSAYGAAFVPSGRAVKGLQGTFEVAHTAVE
jgi:arylsulfatase A-like enzyme